ncbi:MAG: hypothetical protein ACI81R_003541 [Bradymonadia bacterium]|jgi:hypothetical protein
MLQRLIPYSSALALITFGCGDGTTGASDTSSDDADEIATSDTLSDVDGPEAGVESDVASPDAADVDPQDVSTDVAESDSLSEQTIGALRALCDRYAECGIGGATRCRNDIRDLLIRDAYSEAEDFGRCDVALGALFVCLESELDECQWEGPDNRCQPENEEVYSACNAPEEEDTTDPPSADAGVPSDVSDVDVPDDAEYEMAESTRALIGRYCELEEACFEEGLPLGRCVSFLEQAIGIANDPAGCEDTTQRMLTCLSAARTQGCDASTLECEDYYSEFDAACETDYFD